MKILLYQVSFTQPIETIIYIYINVKVKHTYNFPQTIHVINKEWVDGFSFPLLISEEGFFLSGITGSH